MRKAKRKNDLLPIKVFEKSESEQAAYSLMMLIVVGFFGLMLFELLSNMPGVWLHTTPIILLLVFTIWAILLGMTQKLVVYEDGIEYRIGGQRAFTTWDNLCCFEWYTQNRNRTFGIVTYEPVKLTGNVVLQTLHFQMSEITHLPLSNVIRTPKVSGNLIRPNADAYKFRITEFGQLLYQYAPHLFD